METSETESTQEDERYMEVEAVQAVYPELELLPENDNGLCGKLDIAVNLLTPVSLVCQDKNGNNETTESYHVVSHLPPLALTFELPTGYPESVAPVFQVSSTWLPQHLQQTLIPDLLKLWEDTRDQVLYAAIDALYQQAETGFGISNSGTLVLDLSSNATLKDQLLDYDLLSTQKDFSLQTFKCQICQYSRKGSVCTQLTNCRHVFCAECLTTFLDTYITQGYVENVKCPDPNCSKPEILRKDVIPLVGEEMAQRYEHLRRQRELEKDPNIIVCPRFTCQALLRPPPLSEGNLVVCSSCNYAFCCNCRKSWHGKFSHCVFKNEVPLDVIKEYNEGDADERREIEMRYDIRTLAREEKAYLESVEFERAAADLKLKQCPFCKTYVERSEGCNKITCRCNGMFCYLCGEKLFYFPDAKLNPYDHYRDARLPCFEKLFENTEIAAAVLD